MRQMCSKLTYIRGKFGDTEFIKRKKNKSEILIEPIKSHFYIICNYSTDTNLTTID